jgi:hypothetical protein
VAEPIIEYTTYAEVRSALGVSDEELEDSTLALDMYALALNAALKRISAALPADYATIEAKDAPTRSIAEQDVFDAVRLFSVYQIAAELTGLPLFSPKQVTDGKAGFSRYADSPYKEAIKQVRQKLDLYQTSLMSVYASFKSSSTPATRIWMGGAPRLPTPSLAPDAAFRGSQVLR